MASAMRAAVSGDRVASPFCMIVRSAAFWLRYVQRSKCGFLTRTDKTSAARTGISTSTLNRRPNRTPTPSPINGAATLVSAAVTRRKLWMKVRNTRSDQSDLIATDQCNADEPNALRFAFIPCVLRAASFARDYEYKRHGT